MKIFAYGTLMIPEVMYAVTTCKFRFDNAILRDYARFTVKGESYPGIIPVTDAVTEGIIYFDVAERIRRRSVSANSGTGGNGKRRNIER